MVDRSQSGVFNVNDQWATTIRYEGRLDAGNLGALHLRFRNDGATVGEAKLTLEEAREVLGAKNLAAIERAAKDVAGPGKEGSSESFKGELRGKNLEFRQVSLPGYSERTRENAIALNGAVRRSVRHEPVTADDLLKNEGPIKAASIVAPLPSASVISAAVPISEDPRPDQSEEQRKARANAVPDEVAQRFLHTGDKYYFPDKTLAFTDRGTKLKADTENREVVKSLIAIAKAREWEGLRVTGSENFRRQAWREATLEGLGAKGYQPSELERLEVSREVAKRQPSNEIERDFNARRVSDPRRAGEGPQGLGEAGQSRRPEQSAVRDAAVVGTMVAVGAAKYKFDPKNTESYYAKVATQSGERTLWGVDIERAIRESKSQPKVGDIVHIENQGSKPITVKVAEKDGNGEIIGRKEFATHRNTWFVEKQAYLDERDIKAQAFRNGQTAKETLVNRYPDLAPALAAVHVAELFAKNKLETVKEREAFVGLVRESLAGKIARDEPIPELKLRERVVRSVDQAADKATERAAERATKQIGARVSPDRSVTISR